MFVSFSNPSPKPYPEARPSLIGGWEKPGRHLKPREEENLSLWKEKLGKRVLVVKLGRGIPVARSLFFLSPLHPAGGPVLGDVKHHRVAKTSDFQSKDQEKGAPGSLGFGEAGITEKTEFEIMIR